MVLNLALFIPFLTGAASSIEGALQRSLLILSFVWLVAVSIRALGTHTSTRT
jgi:ABC-type transport system involved in cytochrome c biogenesis permease component